MKHFLKYKLNVKKKKFCQNVFTEWKVSNESFQSDLVTLMLSIDYLCRSVENKYFPFECLNIWKPLGYSIYSLSSIFRRSRGVLLLSIETEKLHPHKANRYNLTSRSHLCFILSEIGLYDCLPIYSFFRTC